MKMDAAEMRRRAKRQYEAVRRSLDALGQSVAGDEEERTQLRTGFGWLTGSLDVLAGWLLADDEITRRGQDLIERARHAQGERKHEPGDSGAGPDRDAHDRTEETAQDAAGEPGQEAARVTAVDVVFTLPAEVEAGTVALCGEFNEWSAGDIRLQRGGDGTWQAVVRLEPGRAYRYRYLLDGERWENAWQADGYVPNGYGGTDSVVIVRLPADS